MIRTSRTLPLASTPDHNNSPRPRKKLQKTVGLPATASYSPSKRRSTPVTSSATAAARLPIRAKKSSPRAKTTPRQTSSGPRQAPARALPDLSDPKWLDYARSHHSKESLKLPISMTRELSYLAISKPRHLTALDTRSKMSATRRRAKTPVFAIGQLESLEQYSRHAVDSFLDSERIVDEYRGLVDFRDCESIYSDAHSEPPPSRQGYRDDDSFGAFGDFEPRRQHSSDDLNSSSRIFTSVMTPTNGGPATSPTSDDGTLVSFEEETVYFKPVSFSPEPRSPTHAYSSSYGSNSTSTSTGTGNNPFASPDNLSLQICLDLLTRELSSAIADRRQGAGKRPGSEISALQVWLMIEAFERLRDQVAEMRLAVGGATGVEVMFDAWLKALYTIHDSLAEEGVKGGEGEGDLEALQEALD